MWLSPTHCSIVSCINCYEVASYCMCLNIMEYSDCWMKLGIVTGGQYGSNYGCQPYSIPSCSPHLEGTINKVSIPDCNKDPNIAPPCTLKCRPGQKFLSAMLLILNVYTCRIFYTILLWQILWVILLPTSNSCAVHTTGNHAQWTGYTWFWCLWWFNELWQW